MSIEANKAVVRRFFEEYWNGPDHMLIAHKLWYDAAPDFQCRIEQLIGEGDRVAAGTILGRRPYDAPEPQRVP
jgi:hypothetical protein